MAARPGVLAVSEQGGKNTISGAPCSDRGLNPCRSYSNFFSSDKCVCYQDGFSEHSHAPLERDKVVF